MKHKHCDLIKAWADGAAVQAKRDNPRGWVDVKDPIWCETIEYRIKPKTIKYRNYLLKRFDGTLAISISYFSEQENSIGFIKWLGDWQEVVVE